MEDLTLGPMEQKKRFTYLTELSVFRKPLRMINACFSLGISRQGTLKVSENPVPQCCVLSPLSGVKMSYEKSPGEGAVGSPWNMLLSCPRQCFKHE